MAKSFANIDKRIDLNSFEEEYANALDQGRSQVVFLSQHELELIREALVALDPNDQLTMKIMAQLES